jgi:cell division protease FtsH
MNERTAFSKYVFPLVIVAALIWLAVQTIGGGGSDEKLRFSEALALARQGAAAIDHVTFHPSSQEVDFRFVSGKTRTTVYPVDQSAYELQQLLEDKRIPFDAKSTGESPWWSILTSLLPFVLLFGFWVFLMKNVKRGGEPGEPGPPQRSF